MCPHSELSAELAKQEAVLSCLPYHLNKQVAETAHALGIHYFDLTEDVPTTDAIQELAKTSKGVMAPQCGLAPGFVGIVAASQMRSSTSAARSGCGSGRCRSIRRGIIGYAFNWSPEGVVNEYLNDCEVIEGGARKWVSAMEWLETIYVKGTI